MSLTVEAIQAKQFSSSFRGFDKKEVGGFLEKLATAFQSLTEENERLKGQLESVESELAEHVKQQKSFQNAMLAAQGIVDEMKAKSKVESERILSLARDDARRMRDDANGQIVGMERELDRLRALQGQVREELRRQLNSYLDMVEPTPLSGAAQGTLRQAAPIETPAWMAPVAPAPQAGSGSASGQEENAASDDDLANLYVSIDLPDDTLGDLISESEGGESMLLIDEEPTEEQAVAEEEEGKAEEDKEGPAIPDLDGDMVFSLEDPFDLEEVPAKQHEEEKKA